MFFMMWTPGRVVIVKVMVNGYLNKQSSKWLIVFILFCVVCQYRQPPFIWYPQKLTTVQTVTFRSPPIQKWTLLTVYACFEATWHNKSGRKLTSQTHHCHDGTWWWQYNAVVRFFFSRLQGSGQSYNFRIFFFQIFRKILHMSDFVFVNYV